MPTPSETTVLIPVVESASTPDARYEQPKPGSYSYTVTAVPPRGGSTSPQK